MRAARFLAIVLTLAAIIAALGYLFRLPLTGFAVRSAMASAGLESPQARVSALTIDGVRLENVAAGPEYAPGFNFDAIEVEFRWRRLWRERVVDAVRAGPGSVQLRLDEAGRISIPGLSPRGRDGGKARALPFDRLTLNDIALVIYAPEGGAQGALTAEYDTWNGGEAKVDLATESLGWRSFQFQKMESSALVFLSADGTIDLSTKLLGDIETEGAAARGISLLVNGEGASWREVINGGVTALTGEGRISFVAPEIELRDAQLQALTSATQMQTIFGEQLQRAALEGGFDVVLDESGFQAWFADEALPLALTTPDGASLTFAPQGDAAFYTRSSGRDTSSFQFALVSDGVNAKGAADIEREGGGWRIAAPLEIDEFTSEALSLDGSRIDIDANSAGSQVVADVGVKSGLRKAVIGRLTINDAPFNGAFNINADMNAQRARVVSKSDCFNIESGRGQLEGQALDIRLSDITLCNSEAPLMVYTWTGEAACTISGELAARDGSVKFGKTSASGRPPKMRFDAAYHPAKNRTTIKGDVANGAMAINDAINMSDVVGAFDFELDAAEMRANASLDRLRIAQHQGQENQLLMIAPVMASGKARLVGVDTKFSYALTTPEGYRLGAGAGIHDMRSAAGEAVLTFENLTFSPVGLQPNRVSPALKGIVNAAEGALDGEVRLSWSPDKLTSEADLSFDNISFSGPTQAVTRTNNLNGTVQLTDLFPVRTNGLQTIKVASVDMDALQLGAGEITFELPGDESVTLAKAEFPWFGGSLGVYEATAGFSGEATIPLRASGADLKQIFEYVDIEGLSGEGKVSGDLPVIFEGGRARIENGYFESEEPGVIQYTGKAGEAAASAGEQAKLAFELLRDLRYRSMKVTVNGPLDGRLDFLVELEGTGGVTMDMASGRVPVVYIINLDAALLELLRQANLSRSIGLQIERAQSGSQ